MKILDIEGIEIFNSVYEYLDSNMYLFFPSESEAILVDPHVDKEFLSIIQKKKVQKTYIFLTHEHTDHTSGIYWYQENLECEIICQSSCAEYISNKRKMRPLLTYLILEEKDRLEGTSQLEKFKKEFIVHTYEADVTYDDNLRFRIGEIEVLFEHIPGHSMGSSLILLNGKIAFTGDSLLKEIPVITRFPASNHNQYIEYTLPILSSLDPEMIILPGHGEPFYLKEMIVEGKLNIEYK